MTEETFCFPYIIFSRNFYIVESVCIFLPGFAYGNNSILERDITLPIIEPEDRCSAKLTVLNVTHGFRSLIMALMPLSIQAVEINIIPARINASLTTGSSVPEVDE